MRILLFIFFIIVLSWFEPSFFSKTYLLEKYNENPALMILICVIVGLLFIFKIFSKVNYQLILFKKTAMDIEERMDS